MFPHESVTVHVLVTLCIQPVPVSWACVPVAVRFVLQLSVTLAVPNAADISVAVGLQFNAVEGVIVMTGNSVSRLNVTV